jgi:hypothetical protein
MKSISINPYFQQRKPQQCLEPLLQITGSINIWLSTLLSTRALSICFRFTKAQSYKPKKNVLEYLETRPNTSSKKSYELNQLHALYIQLQCTSHRWLRSTSTPADQQLGRQQWTRCGQSVSISQHKFVNLSKKRFRYHWNHLMESLPFVYLTPSITKYEYWKRHTQKS